MLGSFTYADEFAEVIALLADGALQVADLTSEIASIDDAPAAFERLRDASTMKILVAPNGHHRGSKTPARRAIGRRCR